MTNYRKITLILVAMVTYLNASDQQDKTEMFEIAKQEFSKISHLVIHEGSLSTSFVRNVASHLQENQSISTINLNNSRIGDDHLKLLLPVLQRLNQLAYLHLYDTALTDVGIIALCNSFMIKKPNSLVQIDLNENKYGIEGIKKIQLLEQQYPMLTIKRNMPISVLKVLCE